jgi:hypothetical protein
MGPAARQYPGDGVVERLSQAAQHEIINAATRYVSRGQISPLISAPASVPAS